MDTGIAWTNFNENIMLNSLVFFNVPGCNSHAVVILHLSIVLQTAVYLVMLSIITLLPLLISIAFFTLAERKIIASIQRRKGPNVVGFLGLLQPFADGLKALIKELIIPYQANRFLFILAPSITFILSMTN